MFPVGVVLFIVFIISAVMIYYSIINEKFSDADCTKQPFSVFRKAGGSFTNNYNYKIHYANQPESKCIKVGDGAGSCCIKGI